MLLVYGLHTHQETHQRVSPKSSAAKIIFEAAEKARVEAIEPITWQVSGKSD